MCHGAVLHFLEGELGSIESIDLGLDEVLKPAPLFHSGIQDREKIWSLNFFDGPVTILPRAGIDVLM